MAYAASIPEGRVRLRMKYLFGSAGVLAKDYWKYSAPMFADNLVWGIGFSMYSVIMGHLGNDAVAANSIANIVKNLIVCFCSGLANGGGILVGNELGKGELGAGEEIRRSFVLAEHSWRYPFRLCASALPAGDSAFCESESCGSGGS